MAVSLSADRIQATRPTTEKQAPKKHNTIQVLDGFRAIAILLVISYHIEQKNPSFIHKFLHPQIGAPWTFGTSGVNLFFVLSGFLLFMPYARALIFQAKWPSIRQFYLRRALRILPAYYIALAIDVVVFQPQYLQPDHWKQLFLFLILFMDSTTTTYQQLNGPFWTLAVEWQFYMLLPLVMLGFLFVLKRLKPTPRLRLGGVLGLCFLLIIYGIVMCYIGGLYAHKPGENIIATIVLDLLYGTNGKYFENFAIGMAISGCYIYAQQIQSTFFDQWMKRLSPLILGAGCLILYFAAVWTFRIANLSKGGAFFLRLALLDNFYSVWASTVIALGYGCCMFALLFGPKILRSPLEISFLRNLALISYGLYMWHLPFIIFFHDHILPTLGNLVNERYKLYATYWICMFLVAFPIAITSYIFIEKPCIAFSHKKRIQDRKAQLEQIPTTPMLTVQMQEQSASSLPSN
ncbi:acyltransferase family protein [Dictyobacter formicarum]|uniref:acyltransferase family protein n=1 Tax=Dictyobacter formicarum TaxID=2778368 RepID=UPI00191589CC|nr:acyltransferase [Dictyobacter formicarum]